MIGYPYPADIRWDHTGLASNAVPGDYIAFWNHYSQAYQIVTRGESGWPTNAARVIRPGEGFWFSTSTTQTWTVVKPYTWP